jgi:nicotinamide riboside kinase
VKIALIGTHGVGKTTLCFELAARLKRLDRGVELVTEVARDCPLPINRDTTLDAQAWILHTQCAREIAAESGGDVVVCDRSVLDNYAYLVQALGRRPDLDGWVRRWCGTYAGLFKVPMWQPPRYDGTRDTDSAFQRDIDATIDDLVAAFGVEATALAERDSERWVDAILDALDLSAPARQTRLFGETDG